MKVRLVCCAALLGLLISPAMADIAVSLEQGPGATGLVYADIPLADAIVGFGLDATIDDPAGLSYVGFTPEAPFEAVGSTPDGDGFAGLLSTGLVYGPHVLLGTLSFAGTGSQVDLGYTDGDATEGLALPGTGQFATATFTGAYITPEPASLVLLALGVLALRRR